MLDSLPQPVIFAHRGASAHAPENTLAAFELALEHGADAIELDVKLSADGTAVVIHDATVDRTTGAHGRVNDLSLGWRLGGGLVFIMAALITVIAVAMGSVVLTIRRERKQQQAVRDG